MSSYKNSEIRSEAAIYAEGTRFTTEELVQSWNSNRNEDERLQDFFERYTATFELAVQDADGAWELLGEYPTKEAAEKAAKEYAATGQYHADDSGVVVFGISADPDSGHYEDTFSVEVGIEK